MVEKYLEGHAPKLAGGAGFKSLLVLDGEAEAYIHVTAIKVSCPRGCRLVATCYVVVFVLALFRVPFVRPRAKSVWRGPGRLLL